MIASEIRSAVRSLRRSPAFTATAVLILALGIGATTVIFGIVNAALIRPLPYGEPDRLVRIWESNGPGKERSQISAGTFAAWRERAHAFDALALFTSQAADEAEPVGPGTLITTPSGTVQVHDATVTPNLFTLLGVLPAIGSGFDGAAGPEGGLSRGPVVISDTLWRQAFGGDPRVVGSTIRLEDRWVVRIAGVMPQGFSFPHGIDLWSADTFERAALGSGSRFYGAVGRLKSGATIVSAREDLAVVSAELGAEHPETNRGWSATVLSLQDALTGSYRLALLALFGAVGALLLIACANLSGLLLARGLTRSRELAVRAALGATRGRLVAHLLTESLIVSVCGGALGAILAAWTFPLVRQIAARAVPGAAGAHLDPGGLMFCLATSLATALVAGALPALKASRVTLQPVMSAEGEHATTSRSHSGLQQMFVAGQVAGSLALAVLAVLLIQTFVRLRTIDLGFAPEHVVSIDVRLPIFRFGNEPAAILDRWYLLANETHDLLDRLQHLPGVRSAAATNDVPLSGQALETDLTARSGSLANTTLRATYRHVSPGFFVTIGLPIIVGREFESGDAATREQLASPRVRYESVAIVNQTAANRLWPHENALGQYLSTNYDRATTIRRKVVAIAGDSRSNRLQDDPPAEVYVPYFQEPSFSLTALIRAPLPIGTIVSGAREALRTLDPEWSLAGARTLDDVVADAVAPSRLNGLVIALFAAAGLLLTAVGVYGMLAFAVERRLREVGIRVALGASRRHIVHVIARPAVTAVAAGAVFGLAIAGAAGRLLSGLLYGLSAGDAGGFIYAILALLALLATASALPIRRALRYNPADALRR